MNKRIFLTLTALACFTALPYMGAHAKNVSPTNQLSNRLENNIYNSSLVTPNNSSNSLKGYNSKEEPKLSKQMSNFAKVRENYRYRSIASNTRDLGGYKVDNGKYEVAPDKLIRSNNLSHLTHRGAKKLNQLGVNRVIDLRNNHEISKRPDPDESFVLHNNEYQFTSPIHLNNIDDTSVYSAHEMNSTHRKSVEYGPQYRYENIYTVSPQATKAYKKAIYYILHNKNGAILYHCIQGRDRTGILSAILLSALGVNRNTIYKDYLLTDYYNHVRPYTVQKSELKTFFWEVDIKYGSMKGYLNTVGLNNHNIKKLRKMYLVPINSDNTHKHVNENKYNKRNHTHSHARINVNNNGNKDSKINNKQKKNNKNDESVIPKQIAKLQKKIAKNEK